MQKEFDNTVALRFHLYNSLFLRLPFQGVKETGTYLPLLIKACEVGLKQGYTPSKIIFQFLDDHRKNDTEENKFEILFKMIQYVERLIVLFDSIEDASFEQMNNLKGKGSVKQFLNRVSENGKQEDLAKVISDYHIKVVLTAHPTQFYPGSVLGIMTDLDLAIRANNLEEINLLMQQLGKTAFIKRTKPSPYDEAVSLCWYLENTFYEAITETLLEIKDFTDKIPGAVLNPKLIQIGFWPGGDRDGNPFVSPEITMKVAQLLRKTILNCYYKEIKQLKRRLTFPNLENRVIEIEQKIYGSLYEDAGYEKSEVLLADLIALKATLIEEHDGLFAELVEHLILKVEAFGFHFAALDVRQDSRIHDGLWQNILQKDEFSVEDLKSATKETFEADVNKLEEKDLETITTFRTISRIQEKNGSTACERYVVSNTQSSKHIFEIMHLARIFCDDNTSLDFVPLFETINDLQSAPEIMQSLFDDADYAKNLSKRGKKQYIMLGFSDGTKDGGYFKANWGIYTAKEALTKVCRKNGYEVVFFDGRGGPPARGGGNTHNYYASQGKEIENKALQLTVQGQTISTHFGKVQSCKYNLEQLLTAGLSSAIFSKAEASLGDQEHALLNKLGDSSYEKYLGLKENKAFVPYLERITPLRFFGETNIGSRPVKRNKSDALKFEDLRAIPFVGSWAQMKQNVPGFYGLGTALDTLIENGRKAELIDLYKKSLYFRTLIGNSMQALAKCNMQITEWLADDEEFGAFRKDIVKEYHLTMEKILEISGFSTLLQEDLGIKHSVGLREEIVLPLIVIQQFAIEQIHKGENNPVFAKLILRCMFGIINAARNAA